MIDRKVSKQPSVEALPNKGSHQYCELVTKIKDSSRHQAYLSASSFAICQVCLMYPKSILWWPPIMPIKGAVSTVPYLLYRSAVVFDTLAISVKSTPFNISTSSWNFTSRSPFILCQFSFCKSIAISFISIICGTIFFHLYLCIIGIETNIKVRLAAIAAITCQHMGALYHKKRIAKVYA